MSSTSSTVTYTSIDTDSELGRAFWPADEELSDGGFPRVIVYGYDGLPIQPYIPLEDEHMFPAEEQPLPPVGSPTALSPGYVADSDPEEDPDEDSKEEHADYPADGGDDDDDDDTDNEDEEPYSNPASYVADSDPEEDSEDDPVDDPADGGNNDDDDSSDDDEKEEASKEEEASEKEEAEEEEEHLAPADSVVAPVVDHVPSSEETYPFETDEAAATPPSPPACRTTARISIRPEAPVLLPPEEEVERLLALPTPPPSPLISLSPPSAEERLARCLAAPALPSSPLPRLPHPYGSPNHVRAPPGFRAAMGRLRASSPLPPPVPAALPLPSPPLPPLPSSPLPPLLDSLFIYPKYEVGESSTAIPRPTGGRRVDYGFVGTLDAEAR
ncbi:hypothetical protein Tco_1529906 [Tanacetum coccineum]